jgi:hypothetical protein
LLAYRQTLAGHSNFYGRRPKIGWMEPGKFEEVIAALELYLRFLCARADPGAAEVQRADTAP